MLDDLSGDQYYSYRIRKAVICGSVESDLQYLEIGPIVHSKWLTLGCRILRLYVSLDDPPSALMFLAECCVRVYFPTWFDKKKQQTDLWLQELFQLGSKNNTIVKRRSQACSIAKCSKKCVFAHPENILLAIFGDDDKDVRKQAVSRVQAIRETSKNLDHNLTSENPKSLDKSEEFNMYDPCVNVRRFKVPKPSNTNAKSCFEMVNLDDPDFRQPPAINDLSSSEIASIADNPLKLDHPCHNQAVERHVKVVTKASGQVIGYERRDGLIRQKLESRMIMKKFDTKQQFVAVPVNTDKV